MEPYRTEPNRLPWWVTFAGHGVLTATSLGGVLTTDGVGRWAWLLVLAVTVAAAKVARSDHAAAMAVETDRPEAAEVSPPGQSSGL